MRARNATGDVDFGGVETLSVFTSSAGDTITVNMDAAPGGNVVTATINGKSVAGKAFPREFAGKKDSSTAFLAFSETWVS